MEKLFLPIGDGKFQQRGTAHYEVRAKTDQPTFGEPLPFEFSITGDPNTVMAMIYDTMTGYPEVAKLMLTVFYRFCQDKGIPFDQLKKHTHYK